MVNPPPMPPPLPYTPTEPPPPPSYAASVAQKKADIHASAKSNAVHTVGGHARTNAEIRMAHHPDGSLPAVLAAPIALFSSSNYRDNHRTPANPSSPRAVAGSKRSQPQSLPSPASQSAVAKRTDARQSPPKSPLSLSRRAIVGIAKSMLAAATHISPSSSASQPGIEGPPVITRNPSPTVIADVFNPPAKPKGTKKIAMEGLVTTSAFHRWFRPLVFPEKGGPKYSPGKIERDIASRRR